MELVAQIEGQLQQVGDVFRVSSRDVARTFGKQHSHVLRDIRELDCSAEFKASNFGSREIKVLHGSGIETLEVMMTRDGFTFLAMSFTGAKAAQFKEAYISAFNKMEARLRRLNQLDPLDALEAIVAGLRRQEAQLKMMEGGLSTTQKKLESVTDASPLTAKQVSDVDGAIKMRLRQLGLNVDPTRRSVLRDLKRRFLPAGSLTNMTYKHIPQGEFDAVIKFILSWVSE